MSRKRSRDFTESTGNLLLANLSMVPRMSPPISGARAQLWSTVPVAPAFRCSALEIVGHEMVDAETGLANMFPKATDLCFRQQKSLQNQNPFCDNPESI